ncbi:hypothetical protein [Paenimyroides baculatum]|uniref:Lipocalin-like domain-containing protein n=1 Tax=Paenimyroides baculatum TaxID=2608000 RepID=A0A5M6CJ23_9FLAO|nr:hypothetical protein [Paenimyroides baculatum]KAA5533089.1 hypothetical protein F0460_12370 [Paenimyroides baculatum]
MKKLILLFAFISLFSCTSEENFKRAEISGEWKMTAYLGFVPELPQIEKGSVVWNIDATNISMTNNSEHAYVSQEGTFGYLWLNAETILVNYPEFPGYYKVNLSDNKLRLTRTVQPGTPEVSDQPVLEFEK